MNKNLLTTGCAALLFAGSVAQNIQVQPNPVVLPAHHQHANHNSVTRCATAPPGDQWDARFNQLVEQYKEQLATGKAAAANYTIAVIVHVIHDNEPVGGSGSYNLSQTQINSQITVLNNDYAGTNADIVNVPSAFQSVKAGDCNIHFCMALKDPLGNTLAEPGIERIDRNTMGWTAPPYTSTYINGTIKPATIWDPTKYLNMWVCELGNGLLGYATFPAGSGLTGISGSTGTSTTDGVVMLGSAFGNTGFQSMSAYNKGRTTTHEVGHWLGLRHIWGDGSGCVTDYCTDTPTADQSHFGCISGSTPYHTNACGTGTSPNGEMTMNYMDYTDDACMYMFTLDQRTRMQTCMANGTYRSPLTAASTTICSSSGSTPVANFTYPSPLCAGQNMQFTDASSGSPTSWAWSVNPSSGVTITTATSQNPTINFPSTGTYTVTLTATNSQGSNSSSQAVSVTSCTSSSSCDTLSNINSTDTLTVYLAGSGGYWTGTNGYNFTELGEFYQKTQFATNLNQVSGGIVLFYMNGARGINGTSNVTLAMTSSSSGPGSVLASSVFSISTATATPAVTGVTYAGDPGLSFSSAIIVPYVAMFSSPGALSNDFFLTLTVPTGGTDTVAVFTGRTNHASVNTGWVKYNNTWSSLQTLTTSTANPSGSRYNIGLIPIACATTGMQDQSYLGHNINLFPNPGSGHFNFAIALDHPTDLTFEVINPLGQVMATRSESKFVNGVVTYDFSGLGRGVYFVRITDSENNKTVKKIMIE